VGVVAPPALGALGAVGEETDTEAPLGGFGAKGHDDLVSWLTQVNTQLELNCQGLYREAVSHAGLYLGNIRDPRKKHEMWRSNLHIPYGASAIDTAVSAELDIMLSASPWVQAEGIGQEDQQNSKAVERLIQHTLVVNNWPVTLQIAIRNKRVYGTNVFKISNRPRYSKVFLTVQPGEVDDWQRRVQDASMRSGIPAPDPDDQREDFPGQSRMLFNAWRDIVQKSGLGAIPDKPSSGWKNVMQRNAPDISNQDIFSLRFDPRVYEMQDQPIIIQRSVKTARWVRDRAKPGGIFHAGQVEHGINGCPTNSISTWDEQVSTMLGISGWRSMLWNSLSEDDRPVELLECWRRHDEVPYAIVLNRSTIINRKTEMPLAHGMYPYVALRNNPQSGSFFGLSDLKQTAPMYTHMDKMYNLHLDALLLSVIPVWLSTKSAGLPPDVSTLFQPGRIWSVNQLDAIRPLMKDSPHPDMWRLIADLKSNIDQTQSTTEPVRGGAVTLNRVSATQSERAFSQSLSRTKTAAVTTECELRPAVHQILFLLRDHVSADDRVNTSGRDLGIDALRSVPREKLLLALDQDYNFQGATQAVNRGERMAFFEKFFSVANGSRMLAPPEARNVLAMWWRESGIPGIGSVITESGNAAVVNAAKVEEMRAQAEALAPSQDPSVPLEDEGHDSQNAQIEPGTSGDLGGLGTSTQPF